MGFCNTIWASDGRETPSGALLPGRQEETGLNEVFSHLPAERWRRLGEEGNIHHHGNRRMNCPKSGERFGLEREGARDLLL